MERIMLLEDDLSLIDGLTFALEKQGFDVMLARSIEEANNLLKNNTYDLLILDVTLPDGSGFDLCKKVRAKSDVPIMFLTAKDEEMNIVMGLDIGGDDYVTKPFKLGILISRVNALLRRQKSGGSSSRSLESGGINLVMEQAQAYKNGKSLELTVAEFRLLSYFMQNPNIVLSKEQIFEQVLDMDSNFVEENTLSVYIRRLRVKVEDNPEEPKHIVTVRGLGYKWVN